MGRLADWGQPGTGADPRDKGVELRLVVDGPRQFQVDVYLAYRDNGLEFSLLEGPLRHLGGEVFVDSASNELVWSIQFSGLTTIPSVLSNELAERVIPHWGAALLGMACR